MALEEMAAEARAFYDRYWEIWTALGRGDRDDVETLLGFYNVPLTLAAAEAATTLATDEAVLGLVRGLIAQLRQADYAGSETHRLEVRPLNARTVFIEGEFSRRNRAGEKFVERFGVAYLVIKPGADWRIAAIIPV
jgi:hypothetical protein